MARGIFKLFYDSGWTIKRTKKGHYKAIPPDAGAFVIVSGTPSDFRADQNARCDLRNAGYEILPDPNTGKQRIFATDRSVTRWHKRPREPSRKEAAR